MGGEGSNPRPPACKAGALPAELTARGCRQDSRCTCPRPTTCLRTPPATRRASSAATWQRPPAKGVAIVACMDARLDAPDLLGLEAGDAHVIRNAGGVVTDEEIRALAISQRLMGTTEIVLSSTTPTAGCSRSRTTAFAGARGRDRRTRPPGRPRPSTTWRATCETRLRGSGESVHPAQGERARLRLRREDRRAHGSGLTAREVATTLPPASRACTRNTACVPGRGSPFRSRASRARATRSGASTSGPASTRQPASCVEPFQLA